MIDQTEFSDIAPFNDEEASAALSRLALITLLTRIVRLRLKVWLSVRFLPIR